MRDFLENCAGPIILLVIIAALVCAFFFAIPAIECVFDQNVIRITQETPVIPDNATGVIIIERTVVGRNASTRFRSSSIDYCLALADRGGNVRTAFVSMEDFVNVPDGTVYYDYSYLIRPYNTYDERMNEWISRTWIVIVVLFSMPTIVAAFLIINSAVEVWRNRDDYYVSPDHTDYEHY